MAMEKPQAGRSQLGINKYYFQLNPSLRSPSASSQRNPTLRSAVCIVAAESDSAKRGLHLRSGIHLCEARLHHRSGIRRCEALLDRCSHLRRLLASIFEIADIHERTLGKVIAFAVAKSFETIDRVLERASHAWKSGEDFSDIERL